MLDKIVVVTGGEGSMAKAITKYLREAKFETYNPGRDLLDVTNKVMVKSYMEHHRPWLLVNCAGHIVPNLIRDTSLAEWQTHFDVNVTGAFLCARYACLSGCRIVINIGSTSAFEGRKGWGAYSASKAALISLTETLAEEGVDAYSLNPARTKTNTRKRLFPNEDEETLMSPEKVASQVLDILDLFSGGLKSGSHIILSKDHHYVLPRRSCPK